MQNLNFELARLCKLRHLVNLPLFEYRLAKTHAVAVNRVIAYKPIPGYQL